MLFILKCFDPKKAKALNIFYTKISGLNNFGDDKTFSLFTIILNYF